MNSDTEKMIGIREFVRNTKAISRQTRKGISFIVMRNTEPLFRVEPIARPRTGKYTLKDLVSIRFKGEKDLSKRIDEIVYGA